MSVELEQKKKVVAKAQTDWRRCSGDRAGEGRRRKQQKQVNVESEKISKDEVECKIAEDAQPTSTRRSRARGGEKALELLNKKDMAR